MRSLTLALLLVALVAIPVLDQAQAKEKEWDDWKFDIGIYVPLTHVSGDVSTLTFRDIVDNWKGGINGTFGLKRERWSFNLDLGYVKLEKEQSMAVAAYAEDDYKITTALAISEHEAFIGYQISDPDEGVSEIIFGTRYIGHSIDVADEETANENWWMGFLGARYMGSLFGAETWMMIIRADVGAFDTSGRITWRGDLGAHWRFTDHFKLVLMYKWMGVDYKKGMPEDDDYYYYKATEHGPVVGLGISL
ncbi:MAG: hypothetical protein PVJ42_02335 [bacterium]|jgi:hypothetical protein